MAKRAGRPVAFVGPSLPPEGAPPGIATPSWQHTSPVSHAPSTPPLQSQPWPVHGAGGHSDSGWQVPAPPGIGSPFWQQTRPSSQAPWTPPLHSHPCPVHGGLHSASVMHVPGPPGVSLVPQQISPLSHGDCVPVVHAHPAPVHGAGSSSQTPSALQ